MTDAIAFDADLVTTPAAEVAVAPKKVRAPAKKKVASKKAVAAEKIVNDRSTRAIRRKVTGIMMPIVGLGELVMIALSLSHLALGISIVTGHTAFDAAVAAPTLQDWAFASTFDIVMLAVKALMIFSKETQYTKDLFRYGHWFTNGALIISAGLNSLAFAQHAHGLMVIPAVFFGLIPPLAIFALTKLIASAFMDYSRG